MRSPTASRRPLAATAVLGLLVVLLWLLAPAGGGGPVARAALSVHAAATHDGGLRLPSAAAPERPADAVAALLPLALAAFALLPLARPRQRPVRPPRWPAAAPRRTRAPPASA